MSPRAIREHLLLAAGERPGLLAPALLEAGKEREAVREVVLEGDVAAAVRAEDQVLLHAHAAEHLAPLGNERDAAADEVLGLDRGDVPRRRT